MNRQKAEIGDFLIAHGGVFYDLQKRLRLLHDRALKSNRRAILFVGLVWAVPLLLSFLEGTALGEFAERPFLISPSVLARFLIAVALFILIEKQVEERLRILLKQFVRAAPLLAPGSFEPAAQAVTRALKLRDSAAAEIVCIILAVGATVASAFNMLDLHTSSWAIMTTAEGKSFTVAGWWILIVSSPIFWFLLFRWLWRLIVFSLLLRALARLEFWLVSTHPDGYGGLGFIGQYPNAYAVFVFALSCVVGARLIELLSNGGITTTTYGYIMGVWLVIVFALLAFPLQAFSRSLSNLKEQTLLVSSAQATRHLRAGERSLFGRNISATECPESETAEDVPDLSKTFAATKKLSMFLFSRSALLPVASAALVPLVVAG
jgi:hypothetical protein